MANLNQSRYLSHVYHYDSFSGVSKFLVIVILPEKFYGKSINFYNIQNVEHDLDCIIIHIQNQLDRLWDLRTSIQNFRTFQKVRTLISIIEHGANCMLFSPTEHGLLCEAITSSDVMSEFDNEIFSSFVRGSKRKELLNSDLMESNKIVSLLSHRIF